MVTAHVPPAATRIAPGGEPTEFRPAGATLGVLLIHGYTGYPGEMKVVADGLAQAGYGTATVRLPGHGTDSRDFQRTTWRHWLGAAMERYLELGAVYERTVVGGLSMGGILAAIAASRLGADGLFMLAPAFRVSNRLLPLARLLSYVVPPVRKPEAEQYDSAERQYYADTYWRYDWPRQAASLYHLMRMARRDVTAVRCPVLTVVSPQDQTVPDSVADEIDTWIGRRNHTIVRLERSGHVLTMDVEREVVARAVVDFVAAL